MAKKKEIPEREKKGKLHRSLQEDRRHGAQLYRERERQTREKVIRRFREGIPLEQIAAEGEFCKKTYQNIIKRFQSDGWKGLESKVQTGRKTKLTIAQTFEIRKILAKPPSEAGYGELEKDKWTGPLLVRLIQAKYGIVFNPKYAADWMKRYGTSPEHSQDIQRMLEREKRRESKREI